MLAPMTPMLLQGALGSDIHVGHISSLPLEQYAPAWSMVAGPKQCREISDQQHVRKPAAIDLPDSMSRGNQLSHCR
jgi:hypothetical protein